MGGTYSAVELVDIAKQIERAGEAFYDAAAKAARSEKSKELFLFLMEEEVNHAETFEELLEGLEMGEDWREDDEYQAYLNALIETRVFPDAAGARELVDSLKSDADAVRQAITFEKDTILFFYYLKPMVSEKDQEMIDRLIDEEKSHIRLLSSFIKG